MKDTYVPMTSVDMLIAAINQGYDGDMACCVVNDWCILYDSNEIDDFGKDPRYEDWIERMRACKTHEQKCACLDELEACDGIIDTIPLHTKEL